MLDIYTSRVNADGQRQPNELIGPFEGSINDAVNFVMAQWQATGELKYDRPPPFEIMLEDGSLLDWTEALGLNHIDDEEDDEMTGKPVVLDEGTVCQRCSSHRVAVLSGKCSDLCNFQLGDLDHDGYVPDDVGIGGGDYIEIDYCLDCGQLQGTWPLELSPLEKGETD